MTTTRLNLAPEQRVRISQTIDTREGAWQTVVEGTVVCVARKPTGSWFARGRNDKLWLHRLRIRKDDGELVELVLDARTRITVLDGQEDSGKQNS